MGFRVSVWTTDIASPDGTRLFDVPAAPGGVNVRRYRYVSRPFYRFSNLLFSPGMMVDALASEVGPSLVHLHDFRSFQAAAAYALCQRKQVPLLLQPHGTMKVVGGKHRLKAVYDALFGRELAKRAARIIVLSKSEAHDCLSFGVRNDRIAVIPNGVPLPARQAFAQRGQFRKEHGIDRDVPLILYMGRIRESKGVFLLMRAFELLTKVYPKSVLAVCGPDDGAREKVRRMALEKGLRVLMPGMIVAEKKVEALVDSDVFCLPSLFETQSVALLEAASFGLPILAGLDNVPEEFLAAEAGVFVKLDPISLSDSLAYLFGSEDARKQLGERARTVVERHFRIESAIEELKHLYSEVLENG